MKAIIVGGGLGSRLLPKTKNLPKTLLPVAGKSILNWEVQALSQAGITKIIFVCGYKSQKIKTLFSKLKYYDDFDYQKRPSILHGLMCAEKAMRGGFIFSYSDIIYTKRVVQKLLKTRGNFNLVVDIDWRKGYLGRLKHPISEAELVKTSKGKVIKIGKDVVSPREAHGEFIGLAKFSAQGVKILKQEYQRLIYKYRKRKDRTFQHARDFKKAYLTDMIQELIDRGYQVQSLDIKGGWSEIDTDEDLKRANIIWGKKA